ncbi:MAG TPA: sigma-54-dependent Fis family transcriptional regulator [Acetobacteraceae bacterium]|nr:sigma-54-dependent Fis family transcriptional regulator [Acetobacteraceae bacterium]
MAPVDLLAPEISASWTRCLQSGLDPRRPPPFDMIGEAALRAAREEAEAARVLALAEMQALYHQIAGSNFLIAFADPNGVLLDTIVDPSFHSAARTASIRPGTLWTEARCGTNALGTANQIGQPITVHGAEHFFAQHNTLTCTAAPVFGANGTLAGVLDASSNCGSRQQHTRALVGMAATQIENGLFREHHRSHLVVAFHNRGEYLHTLSVGLLALRPDGIVLGTNPQARFLLQGLPALAGRHFDDVFRTAFTALMDGARSRDYQRLEDRVGSAFVAMIENARPMPLARAAPQPRAPVAGTIAPDFVADDPAVVAALRQIEAGALRRLPILIRGETGTGKEQLARHAHAASRRRGPFVPVNCAALSDSLIEAELFGHAEGAFTGARRGGAPGLVCEAQGGTLFLDEIGAMPMPLQAVLLRLLDDWTVRPVGGGRGRVVDVLLVAATNAELEELVADGRFRADLYYRLDAVSVRLPPLRARQDFAAIARRMLAGIAPAAAISDDAIDRLATHPWHGNIRELRNVLTRLTLAAPERMIDAPAVGGVFGAAADPGPSTPPSLREAMRMRILSAHRENGGNVSGTARQLGVSRNTIYRAIGMAGVGHPG